MRIKPKKNLGQNFLIDRNIAGKIVSSLSLGPSDTVLEIGAGRGEISSLIAPSVRKFYALELDKSLLPILSSRLKDYDNAVIINRDILKLNLNDYVFGKDKIKVFGNIPYYISSPIIEYLIKNKLRIKEAFITVQKEFARRVVASPGSKEYGSFSVFVQYFAIPKIILQISRGCFYPVPKVDSSLLYLSFRDKPSVNVSSEELLFWIIRSAFNQRRKTLKNSLKGKASWEKIESFLVSHKKALNARPEELSLEDFADLANSLS